MPKQYRQRHITLATLDVQIAITTKRTTAPADVTVTLFSDLYSKLLTSSQSYLTLQGESVIAVQNIKYNPQQRVGTNLLAVFLSIMYSLPAAGCGGSIPELRSGRRLCRRESRSDSMEPPPTVTADFPAYQPTSPLYNLTEICYYKSINETKR